MPSEQFVRWVGVLTSFGWLAYWTGRWYKEWYFRQFGIPYEVLGFDPHYYVFGSWATIATSVGVVILASAPIALAAGGLWWPWAAVSLLLTGTALALQFWHPLFHPEAAAWKRLLGSRDLVVMAFGLLSLGVFATALLVTGPLPAPLPLQGLLRLPWAVRWLAAFLLTWAYLAWMGYAEGVWHGKAAIWQGKMGTRWVKHDGTWWVFAVRVDAERNFLFDRVKHRTKAVKDAEIDEWDGAVTRDPK